VWTGFNSGQNVCFVDFDISAALVIVPKNSCH
jgi:hypothetical protein